jgi:hypothetical protein
MNPQIILGNEISFKYDFTRSFSDFSKPSYEGSLYGTAIVTKVNKITFRAKIVSLQRATDQIGYEFCVQLLNKEYKFDGYKGTARYFKLLNLFE